MMRRFLPAFLLAILWHCVAFAGPITIEMTFGLYGDVENKCFPGPGSKGVCAAASMINSFEYLRNQYPGVYGTTNVIPDSDGNGTINHADLEAARDRLAIGTWGVNNEFLGIYSRPGGLEDLWNAKVDWFNYFAPGTTIVEGEVNTAIEKFDMSNTLPGSRIYRGFPSFSFLKDQIAHGEDVEIAFKDPTGGTGINHAVTLTGVSFDPDDPSYMKITYLDSNDPTHKKTADLWSDPLGGLRFNLDGKTEEIYLAFGESPVPEPASLVLLGSGLVAIGAYLRRRRLSTDSH